jgi:hypothetical protein
MHPRSPALIAVFALAFVIGTVAIAAETDVAGTWDMTVESPQGTAHPMLVLRQNGSRITGTYRGRLGEAPLQGSLTDDRIQFSVTLKFQDQSTTVTYTGTVDRDAMNGTAQFGENGSGKWSARRKS